MANIVVSCVDNINDLPDEILRHILSFLPIKDAVCTSILSRRWSYLFTLISNLNFELDDDRADEVKVMRFMSVVDKVLFLSKKTSINRFRLCWEINWAGSVAHMCESTRHMRRRHIEPKRHFYQIRALISRNVQELDLSVENTWCRGLPLPISLFSCKTLVILKLEWFQRSYDFKVPTRVCLSSLKVFHLSEFGFSDDGSSERLFSSCPSLEDLVVDSCVLRVGYHKFSVSNPSLKRLTMTYVMPTSLPKESALLVINAPRLVYFKYSSSFFRFHQFVDVHSLAEAVIHFTIPNDLFNGLKNVQSLKISSQALFVLRYHRARFPLLCKLTYLKISRGGFDMDCLSYFLCHSCCLEKLVFQELSDKWDTGSLYLLGSWNHLAEIEILSFGGEEAHMKIVEYFLNNALVLEKLTIQITASGQQHPDIMKEILALPRASKKCLVTIV